MIAKQDNLKLVIVGTAILAWIRVAYILSGWNYT